MSRQTAVAAAALLGAWASAAQGAAGDTKPVHPADNPVLHWTALAVEVFPQQPGPILDGRAFAILHAAVHDAVNGVERRYQPYTADLSSPGASLDAAVATAAHDVLIALAPDHGARIESEYASALAAAPDGPAESEGVALGRQCAQANLQRRAGDGVPVGPWPPQSGPITEPVYVPTGRAGDYEFTPPFDQPPLGPIALFPGWGRLELFATGVERPRFVGPDALDSRQYANDLNHLKSVGSLNSTSRTADQTEIARFWFEGLDTWYRIAITVIRRHALDSWRAARILALMSFAVADADIVVFEAKYRFRSWRPYTAIRRAAEDGNDFTEPDDGWLPLLWPQGDAVPPPFFIPPIPEYPSSAAIVSAAAAEVLRRLLGDRHSFEATSTTLPGVTRHFTSFTQAAREARLSRAYGGIHFLRAIEDGRAAGRRLGATVSRMLPPVHR